MNNKDLEPINILLAAAHAFNAENIQYGTIRKVRNNILVLPIEHDAGTINGMKIVVCGTIQLNARNLNVTMEGELYGDDRAGILYPLKGIKYAGEYSIDDGWTVDTITG